MLLKPRNQNHSEYGTCILGTNIKEEQNNDLHLNEEQYLLPQFFVQYEDRFEQKSICAALFPCPNGSFAASKNSPVPRVVVN